MMRHIQAVILLCVLGKKSKHWDFLSEEGEND
jgi:hypothetical protein